MDPEKRISDDEIILRRLSDNPDNTKVRGEFLTATSLAIRPRRTEKYSSWSRRFVTSARELLDIEAAKGRDVAGWQVTAISVREVRELGLDVVAAPTDEDPGHCHIVPTSGRSSTYKDPVWSKLAKKTRVVPAHSANETG